MILVALMIAGCNLEQNGAMGGVGPFAEYSSVLQTPVNGSVFRRGGGSILTRWYHDYKVIMY